MTQNPTAPDPLDTVFSSQWLTAQEFPPVEYAVPGIIPEGLTLLVAAPKIGKSWMVLGIAQGCAEGIPVFGSIPVTQRPVLYLALEDGPRRLQDRLKKLGVTTGSNNLFFLTSLASGLIPTIGAFAERNPKSLIIIDTLGKVRNVYAGNDAYQKDYQEMSILKEIADRHPGTSILVVHHTNKGQHGDFLSSVSGTQGIAGAADTILAIHRDRNDTGATLDVTSRDATEGTYAITMTEGIWTLDGSNLQEAAQAVQHRKSTDGVGDTMTEVIDLVNKYPEGIKPKDIATLLHLEDNKVRTYLRRAIDNGRIESPKRGLYTPVTSVTSVTFPELEGHKVTQVTQVTRGSDAQLEAVTTNA